MCVCLCVRRGNTVVNTAVYSLLHHGFNVLSSTSKSTQCVGKSRKVNRYMPYLSSVWLSTLTKMEEVEMVPMEDPS